MEAIEEAIEDFPFSMRERPMYMDKDKKMPTRLCFREDSWGYSWGPDAETWNNYVQSTNFRLYFEGVVPSHPASQSNQPDGSIETLVKMATRVFRVVLDADSLLKKTSVLTQLSKKCPGALFMATGMRRDDWAFLVNKAMEPLHSQYRTNPVDKDVIKFVGMQPHRLPPKWSDLQPGNVIYFFNEGQGILDSKGQPLKKPNLVFDHSQMQSAKQIKYVDGKLDGFLKYLEEPFARGSGDVFMENVMTTVMPVLYGWAAPINSVYLKKLPTIVLEGPPGSFEGHT